MPPSFLKKALVHAMAVSTAVAPMHPALAQATYLYRQPIPLTVVEFAKPGEAQLTVSSASVAFGSVGVGQTSEVRSVLIENVGPLPASLGTGFVVSGSGFSGSSNCPALLPAGAQCAVSITFTPQDEGAASGTLTYAGAPAPLPVTLTGTGLGPGASLSADTGSSSMFGSVPVFTSKTNAYIFRNTGGTTLTGVKAAITGADLSLTANTCGTQAAPVSLAAGASCTMSVKFEPQAADMVTGELAVTSSAPNSPHTLELTAEGTASGRLVTVSPAVGGKTLYDLDTEILSFASTGTWTVTPVTSFDISMKAWGGGGGSIINYKSTTGYGGAGGFAAGGYSATARQPLVVSLPAKGGAQGTGQWVAGAADGGAYAGVFNGSISQANSLIVAGGGGGAMANGHGSANGGGGGQNGANSSWGGINSYCPSTRLYGTAGSTSAGGLGGQPYNTNYVLPQDGTALGGGNGGGWGVGVAPYGSGQAWDWTMGAGGGGGYFGGGGSAGGGGCAGSAGGGSSFVGAGLNNPLVINGSGTTPGNSGDVHRGTAGERDTFVGKVVFAPYTAPSVSLSTSSLSLGAAIVGDTSPSASVLVLNSGGSLGTVSSVSVSGTDAASFAASTNCGGYVQPNGSCAVTVTFTPSSIGTKSATLSVQTSGGTLNVALSGTAQTLTASGNGAFGDVHVGDTTATRAITLANSGTLPVNVTSIAVSGTNASLFTPSVTSCSGVVASSPCTVNVTFAPTAAITAASATLTFTTATGTRTVALSGNGKALTVGSTLTAGAASSTTVTPAAGLSLSNVASARVYNGVTLAGVSSSVSWSGSALTVNFDNISASGTLNVALYDSANFVVARGTATVSPSSGSLTANTSTTFPAAAIDQGSSSLTFTFTAGVTSVTGVSATLANGTDMAITANTCNNVTVAANGTCSVTVTFTPMSNEVRTATLTVGGSTAPSKPSLTLTGQGTGGRIVRVNGTRYDLDTQPVKLTTTGTHSVVLRGVFPLTLKVWGGAGADASQAASWGGLGGGGGYAGGVYTGTAGQTLTVHLPNNTSGNAGGVSGSSVTSKPGHGGNYAGVFLTGTVSRANVLLMAGGGSGGGGNYGGDNGGFDGVGGGGLNGNSGGAGNAYGRAATTAAAGARGEWCEGDPTTNYIQASAGSSFTGGAGGTWSSVPSGKGGYSAGSGGGGGYYGGGGGAGGWNCNGTGGSGSSYAAPSLSDVQMISGTSRFAGNNGDADFNPANSTSNGANGRIGQVVLR